jgi:hypothetical protein
MGQHIFMQYKHQPIRVSSEQANKTIIIMINAILKIFSCSNISVVFKRLFFYLDHFFVVDRFEWDHQWQYFFLWSPLL